MAYPQTKINGFNRLERVFKEEIDIIKKAIINKPTIDELKLQTGIDWWFIDSILQYLVYKGIETPYECYNKSARDF